MSQARKGKGKFLFLASLLKGLGTIEIASATPKEIKKKLPANSQESLGEKAKKENITWILSLALTLRFFSSESIRVRRRKSKNKNRFFQVNNIVSSPSPSPPFMPFEFTGINNDDYGVLFAMFSLLFFEQISFRGSGEMGNFLIVFPRNDFLIIIAFRFTHIKSSPSEALFKFFFFNHLTNESCVGFETFFSLNENESQTFSSRLNPLKVPRRIFSEFPSVTYDHHKNIVA